MMVGRMCQGFRAHWEMGAERDQRATASVELFER